MLSKLMCLLDARDTIKVDRLQGHMKFENYVPPNVIRYGNVSVL